MRRQLKGFLCAGMLFLFGSALTACSSVGEYKRPEVALPETYRGSVSAGSVTPSDSVISSVPYRSFFADKGLCALIDSAMVNNIDLQVGLKNIDYAEQTLKQAKLGLLPTLSIGAEGSLSRTSDNGLRPILTGDKAIEDYTASAIATWEADIWGKIRSRKKSALASYLKTRDAATAVRTRIVADVATGYYNLLMLDSQLGSSKKNLALADTTLKMMRLQYSAGQTTALAVQQQDAQRQTIALSVPVIEQKIALQENALSILCGRMPAAIQRDRSLFTLEVNDQLPAGIPSALLQNRPDVRAAELAVRAAHADMGEAKANLYPSFTVTAEAGVNSFRSSNWFTVPGSLFGYVQGGVLQPIFQHGQLKAQYEQSKIKREQAELVFKLSLLKAVGEVSDALVQLDKIKSQEVIAAARVTTLKKGVSNAVMLFQAGMATYLEIMVAQSMALQADLDLADIRRQHFTAKAELYRALGGGWR
jgi:outer membrane protein, multidrug efflux system